MNDLDSIDCKLMISGALTRDQAKKLYAIIAQNLKVSKEDAEDGLEGLTNFFQAPRVRGGKIPKNLSDFIISLGLGYLWYRMPPENGATLLTLWDPWDRTLHHVEVSFGDILVHLSKVHDPLYIAQARAAEQAKSRIKKAGFHVAETSHHLIEILSEREDLSEMARRARECSSN